MNSQFFDKYLNFIIGFADTVFIFTNHKWNYCYIYEIYEFDWHFVVFSVFQNKMVYHTYLYAIQYYVVWHSEDKKKL